MKKKILLYGPYVLPKKIKNAYGGGTGGYTRNMITYLNYFQSENYEMVPSFHTFRGQLKWDNFIWRMLVDTIHFLKDLLTNKVSAVHILGQYRTAIPREAMVCFFSKMMGKPIIYELKAGAFIDWYDSTHGIMKKMADYVMSNSSFILAEGKPYIPYVKEKFGKTALYYPNYIPSKIIPQINQEKLKNEWIKIMFAGYCYKDKGVFELVEGCNNAAETGIEIQLTLIGQEHEDFTKWLDEFNAHKNLIIERKGRQEYEVVLEAFKKNDVYGYPTYHKGEGHNNTINEAMMNGLVIITTQQGFLGTIITNENGYSLESGNIQSVEKAILDIHKNRNEAKEKGKKAKQTLMENFTSDILYKRLVEVYEQL